MKKLSFLLLLCLARTAFAQYDPQVVTPVYTGGNTYRGVNNLYFSATLGSRLFFNVQLEDSFELYMTDGTAANTLKLKTLPQVLNMAAFDNNVYFSFGDPVNGTELWKTDGTLAGTVSVSTLGSNSTAATQFTVSGSKMYFVAGNSASPNSPQLYILEAGSNTPQLLRNDLYEVSNLTALNGKIYFSASDTAPNIYNRELYTTDGTVAGTIRVKDIWSGTGDSNPQNFKVYHNKLYFSANDGTHGREVWTSDGIESGTKLLKDINSGSGDAFYGFNSGVYNGKLYFAASDGVNAGAMWVTDGTPGGTEPVKVFNTAGSSGVSGFVEVNGKMIVTANDGTHGFELWVSDGTAQNTTLLKDINPGQNSANYAVYATKGGCGNVLFFDGDSGANNVEPWVTNGTEAGTYQIKDIHPTEGSLDYETRYVQLGSKIYFSARLPTGRQLFSMNADCTLNVNENPAAAIRVYPNPAHEFINISCPTDIRTVEIYNSAGQKLLNMSGNQKQVDVRQLTAGIYIIKITTGNGKAFSTKIIKK
ncbi:T9SS type A sorting domain-containing protein [Kaistella palustris]|uniref:T9SS type A sorting domain-containing protein n=1 Tax=Kaistella palustris TaxID=493376 RepID=UPI00041FE410|nr:T9SS type A sorting domain-containing protein [Kaistella palustris]